MIEAKFRALMKNGTALVYLEPLKAAMALHSIDNEQRVSHFLAQLAHESAGFTVVEENLNYSAQGLAKTWPKRFANQGGSPNELAGQNGSPNELAKKLHRKPELIANNVYANRMGNGDEASGDGWRYRGRGLIQLTGKNNYRTASFALFDSDFLLTSPDKVLLPDVAAMTAAWFWNANGLNELADAGDIEKVTRRINGGRIGLEHREKLTLLALATTGVST
jgi:putative chitinase